MDPLAQEYAASQWHSSKFRLVPDPLGPEPGDFRPVAASGPIAERPLTLLIAGALSPRKGIHSLVDALSKTSEATRQSLRVHVVGKPDSTQIDYVAKNLQRLRDLGVQTVDDLRFVDDEELDHCIMRSHIVLTPYVDFKGSSGILIRAAHFGKPVLSTERGLLGRLVLTRKLGQAFDTTNPELFAHHLETIVTTGWVEGFEPEFARRFADDSDPSVFSKVLLSAAD
jgi:glycosyltransferase involved in cell wall biosynthesis